MSLRDPDPRTSSRCIPAEDLTAFAFGEMSAGRRSEVSRHLLQCQACRAKSQGSGDVLDRLRSFGAAPSWESEVDAAAIAMSARSRARRYGAYAGAAAAAILVAGFATLGPSASTPQATPSIAAARVPAAPPVEAVSGSVSPAATALLKAQAEDGRWVAGARTSSGRRDEGATGLALLALLTERRDPASLHEGVFGRAVGQATRWLASRQAGSGDFAPTTDAAGARDHTLATAALLEVYAATRDAHLKSAVEKAVRRLPHDPTVLAALDASTASLARRTLVRAHDVGLKGSEDVPVFQVAAERTEPAPGFPGVAPGESACARALAVVDRSPRG